VGHRRGDRQGTLEARSRLDEDIDEYLVLGGTVISVQTSNGWAEVDARTGAVTPTVIREKEDNRRNDSFNVGHGLSYSKKAKTLTYRATDGHVVWTRAGEESENAGTAVVHNVVVWPKAGREGRADRARVRQHAPNHQRQLQAADRRGSGTVVGMLKPEGSKLHIVSISQ